MDDVEVLPFSVLEIIGEVGSFELELGDCIEKHDSGPDEERWEGPDRLGSSKGVPQERWDGG